MTTGRPMSKLIRFSLPLLVGNLAQQLCNTVDSIVVGKYVGDTALAAVGTAGPILNLLLVLLIGVATGASILASQYFGAKDREGLSRVVGSTIVLTVLSGLIMMVLGYFASSFLIGLIAPPPDVAEGAVTYLKIICIIVGIDSVAPSLCIQKYIGWGPHPSLCHIQRNVRQLQSFILAELRKGYQGNVLPQLRELRALRVGQPFQPFFHYLHLLPFL